MTAAARLLATLLSVLAVTVAVTACGDDSGSSAGAGADDSSEVASNDSGGGGGQQGGGGGGEQGGGGGGNQGGGGGGGGQQGGGEQGGGEQGGGEQGGGSGGGGEDHGGGTEPAADNQVVLGPQLLTSSPPVRFQAVAVGGTHTLAISVKNLGTARKITAVSIDGDKNDFRLDVGSCSIGSEIAAGDSCTLRVTFAPTQEGVRTAQLGIDVEPGRSGGRSLEGTGSPRAAPADADTGPRRESARSDTGESHSDSGPATNPGTTTGDVEP